jgi:selenocysteine lyase/cysteine desulfurase
LNYVPWVNRPKPEVPEISQRSPSGISRFECGTYSVITYAAQHESFKYIDRLGIARIQAHARPLIQRIRKGMPARDFSCITPDSAGTPIITFRCRDIESVRRKINQAAASGKVRISITGPNSALTVGRFGDHLRFSVSVFNNQQDVDTILEILS